MNLIEKTKQNFHVLITVPSMIYLLGSILGKIVLYLWMVIAIVYGFQLIFPKVATGKESMFRICSKITWGGAVLAVYVLIAAFIQSLVTGKSIM